MGEFKHFVVVKFNEGVVVEDIIKGMEKMVSGIDYVKAFEWYAYVLSFKLIHMFFLLITIFLLFSFEKNISLCLL